jgi:hypothetical protein
VQAIVPIHTPYGNFGLLYWGHPNSSQAPQRVQWLVPSIFHNTEFVSQLGDSNVDPHFIILAE